MMQSSFVASNYEELRQLKHIVQCDRQQLERLSVIINFLLFSQFLPGYGLINHFFRGKLSLPNRYQGNGENAQSYKGSSGGNWVLLIPTLSLTKDLLTNHSHCCCHSFRNQRFVDSNTCLRNNTGNGVFFFMITVSQGLLCFTRSKVSRSYC